MHSLICALCEAPFQFHRKKKYCSEFCAREVGYAKKRKKHESKIETVFCDHCNKELKRFKSWNRHAHNFCNRTCASEFNRNKIQTKCCNCDKDIEVHPCKLGERNFCSRECTFKFKQNDVVVTCNTCKTVFTRPTSDATNKKYQFCNKTCQYKFNMYRGEVREIFKHEFIEL